MRVLGVLVLASICILNVFHGSVDQASSAVGNWAGAFFGIVEHPVAATDNLADGMLASAKASIGAR